MIISSLSHENLIPKKRSLFHGDKPNLLTPPPEPGAQPPRLSPRDHNSRTEGPETQMAMNGLVLLGKYSPESMDFHMKSWAFVSFSLNPIH
jgi:hypothetical protein